MRSTFFGLNIGRQALQAQQRALDVTAHNIANANTEGFSRQRAVMATTTPFAYPSVNRPIGAGQIGTGVMVEEVKRMRDSFIDLQVRQEVNKTGEWETKNNSLQKLEVIFNEPSDAGLRTVLDQFWEAWQELSKKPELEAVRSLVRQRGIAVAETFNHLDRQLTDLAEDLDASVKIKVDEINNIAGQVAALNDQIVRVEVQGDNANDLRDKRDLLLDELSKIVQITVKEDNSGAVTVSIGGRALVSAAGVSKISAVPNGANNGYVDLQWAVDGTAVSIQSGSIKGMLDIRDITIPSYRQQLDDLANALVTSVNAEHVAGYGLNKTAADPHFNFFDAAGTTAATISIDAAILGDLDNIAAASTAADPLASPSVENSGDGSNALNIAELKHQALLGTATLDDYYRGMIAQLGVEAQESSRMVDNQNLLLSQLENRRQEVSGVSLDEEMTNMIKFQHAYNAAARTITAMDEMLDTIVNRLGLVGR
ncbi:flagellar hook-associated protein FlgK [Thermincola ferriacetica]|uniref:Flagellar hook-associated protein 1 n=1 Tax=Thermincola ferriacetica TaxID=281456 RepID=A0A0L6W3Q2_9FIRM|nr:flagellar hook-associated protein FlgK [Thermincola ferriacetica]KNZ70096.1 flagellar hook-associated protein FlgK [Thermincola ferriacetica]